MADKKLENRRTKHMKAQAYAKALVDAVLLDKDIDKALRVRDALYQMSIALLINSEIVGTLTSEDLKYQSGDKFDVTKHRIIESIFHGVEPEFMDILYIAADNSDLMLVPIIEKYYNKYLEEKLDVTIVDVTTVVELDDHLRSIISKKAKKDLNSEVILHEHIDKKIIGGVVLGVHESTIDASFATHLINFKQELLN